MRLQHLRALAALIVTASHSVADVNRLYGLEAVHLPIPGQFGVEIFFVISGFIIFLVSTPRGTSSSFSVREFLANRVWRIVPLYWLFTVLFIGLALALPNAVNRSELSISHILSSFLFLPLEGPAGNMSPVYSLGWSLNYEVFFYLLFAAFLCFGRWVAICGVSLLLVTLVALHPLTPEGSAAAVWTMPYLLEFAAGMWIAAGTRAVSFRLPAWTFWPVICAAVALSAAYFSTRTTYAVSPATILLAVSFVALGAFSSEPTRRGGLSRIMAAVGDSSYSLYLSHMFVIRAAILPLGYLGVADFAPAAVTWAIIVGLCAFVAYTSYLLLERKGIPALRLRMRNWRSAHRARSLTFEGQA